MRDQDRSGSYDADNDISVVETFRTWWKYRWLVLPATLAVTAIVGARAHFKPSSFTARQTVRIINQPVAVSAIPAISQDEFYELAVNMPHPGTAVARHPDSLNRIRAYATGLSAAEATNTLETWSRRFADYCRRAVGNHLSISLRAQLLADSASLNSIQASLDMMKNEKQSADSETLSMRKRLEHAEASSRFNFYSNVLSALESGATNRSAQSAQSVTAYADSLLDLYDTTRYDPIECTENRPRVARATITTFVLSLLFMSLAAFLADAIRRQSGAASR